MDKLIYGLFLLGAAVWQYPLFYSVFAALRSRVYIRRNLKAVTGSDLLRRHSLLGRHIGMVIGRG